MVNSMMLSVVCGVVYFIVRFLEMRFVMKESKPLKFLLRDSLFVIVSVYVSHFIIGQIDQNDLVGKQLSSTPAFIGEPDF